MVHMRSTAFQQVVAEMPATEVVEVWSRMEVPVLYFPINKRRLAIPPVLGKKIFQTLGQCIKLM